MRPFCKPGQPCPTRTLACDDQPLCAVQLRDRRGDRLRHRNRLRHGHRLRDSDGRGDWDNGRVHGDGGDFGDGDRSSPDLNDWLRDGLRFSCPALVPDGSAGARVTGREIAEET